MDTIFRQYKDNTSDPIAQFYRDNHRQQTLAFAKHKIAQYAPLQQCKMGTWQAIQKLDDVTDDSDPDTELSQLDHLLQTAEAIRQDGHPRWMQLAGLIHDLGKVLCLFGEPQWAVVGDTFPLGCQFSEKIVYAKYFDENSDTENPDYQTPLGIYEPHEGLDHVTMSWGHDEYLYQVVKAYLPLEALYIIRYHSFYSGHQARAYDHLMNEQDQDMFQWVRTFQTYDLYSKANLPPDRSALMSYYQDLVTEFLPETLNW